MLLKIFTSGNDFLWTDVLLYIETYLIFASVNNHIILLLPSFIIKTSFQKFSNNVSSFS